MEKCEIVNSIACCGLVCKLCHLAGECDGCPCAPSLCGEKTELSSVKR